MKAGSHFQTLQYERSNLKFRLLSINVLVICLILLYVLEMAKGGEQHWRNPNAVMEACKRRQWWNSGRMSDIRWIIPLLCGLDKSVAVLEGIKKPIQYNSFCFYFSLILSIAIITERTSVILFNHLLSSKVPYMVDFFLTRENKQI